MDYSGIDADRFIDGATSDRFEWIDLFKGIAILCVVYGHVGGISQYVYQFHMAAFFFISGYLANLKKYGLIKMIYSKAYALLLPFFTMFFLFSIGIVILKYFGWYDLFFTTTLPPFRIQLKDFFGNLTCSINLLGAAWFLVTLFQIFIMHKVIFVFSHNQIGWHYVLLSCFFYVWGLYLFGVKHALPYSLDLAFVGQGYFALGVLCKDRRFFQKTFGSKGALVVCLFYGIFALFYFSAYIPSTIHFPARTIVGSAYSTFFAACSGIVLCYCLSNLLMNKRIMPLRKAIVLCGHDSLGILLLHFLMFKIAYAILAVAGVVGWSYLANFVPTGNRIITNYGAIIFLISVISSLLFWNLLCRLKYIGFLLGNEKAKAAGIYATLSGWWSTIAACAIFSDGVLSSSWKWHRFLPFALALIILGLLTSWTLSPNNFFAFDDYYSLYQAKFHGFFDTFFFLPQSAHNSRPLRDLFLSLTLVLTNYNPQWSHAVIYVLHIVNCALLFIVMKSFYRKFNRNGTTLPLITMLVWGAWPKAMLASFWLSGANDSLGMFFTLLLLVLYYSAPGNKWRSCLRGAGVVILYFLALRTKEFFITTPAIIMILDCLLLVYREKTLILKRITSFRPNIILCILWMMAAVNMYMILYVHGNLQGSYEISFSPVVIGKNVLKYLSIYFDYSTMSMNFIMTPFTYIIIAGTILYLCYAGSSLFKEKKIFPIILFLLFLCSISTVLVLPAQNHMLYLYAPSVYCAIALSSFLYGKISFLNRYLTILFVGLFLFLLIRTPATKGLRNYWKNLGQEEKIAIASMEKLGPVPENTTMVLLGLDDRYNIFTYAPAKNRSYILSFIFGLDNIYREYTPHEVNTAKPYFMCINYPNIDFLTMEQYIAYWEDSRPEITELIPARTTVEEGFQIQPNGLSALAIQGKNFTRDSRVYINGVMVNDMNYGNSDFLTCYFPPELLLLPGNVEVIVVNDSHAQPLYKRSTLHEGVWELDLTARSKSKQAIFHVVSP